MTLSDFELRKARVLRAAAAAYVEKFGRAPPATADALNEQLTWDDDPSLHAIVEALRASGFIAFVAEVKRQLAARPN